MASPWLALVGYAVLVYVAAPRADGHRASPWARATNGASPSTALLTASVLVTWSWRIGSGSSGALLAQNVLGLLACFVAYGVGLAFEVTRARRAEVSSYFEPVRVVEEP